MLELPWCITVNTPPSSPLLLFYFIALFSPLTVSHIIAITINKIPVSSSVTASNINSQSATSGQVLTANGSGGASWQTAGGGGGAEITSVSMITESGGYDGYSVTLGGLGASTSFVAITTTNKIYFAVGDSYGITNPNVLTNVAMICFAYIAPVSTKTGTLYTDYIYGSTTNVANAELNKWYKLGSDIVIRGGF